MSPFPSATAWTPEVKKLGVVTANSGRWPLSLHSVPPDYTFHSALRANAVNKFAIPEAEVVLGEVTVEIGAELDGTIRDWTATAEVGQKKAAPTTAEKPIAEKLAEIKKLLEAGVISQSDYDSKKKSLLESL